MKITRAEVIPVTVPMDPPIEGFTSTLVVVARLSTDDGVQGLGHLVTLSARHLRSLVATVEELGELLIGEDPREPERLYRKIVPGGNWSGPGGAPTIAAGALDMAVWDLMGKAAGLPLYRLLGGYRDRVPAYASVRLGRNRSLGELAEVAAGLVREGWRAMKMNLGAERTPEAEEARVRSVREAMGDGVKLMVDVNQRWGVSEAIRMGRRLEPYRLDWLEDPTMMHDIPGHTEIARALDVPIAIGESYFGITPYRYLMEARAMDIANVDMMHVGGITPFRKVAAMAEAYGMQVASHVQHEVNAHLIAAVPNGFIVEHMSWSSPVFRGLPELENGELVLTSCAGHGLELDEDFIRKHRA